MSINGTTPNGGTNPLAGIDISEAIGKSFGIAFASAIWSLYIGFLVMLALGFLHGDLPWIPALSYWASAGAAFLVGYAVVLAKRDKQAKK